MEWRRAQQLKIFIVVIIPVVIIGFFAFRGFYPAPSCFDGKKNQHEEAIDCGGECVLCKVLAPKPIEERWVRLVLVSENVYDVVVELLNPNADYGVVHLPYRIEILSGSNSKIAERAGETFFLPAELKHIIQLNIFSSLVPSRVNLY